MLQKISKIIPDGFNFSESSTLESPNDIDY